MMVSVLDARWHSHLPFREKVFLQSAMVGGLPLLMALKRRHISNGTCLFYAIVDKYDIHKFITCPIVIS